MLIVSAKLLTLSLCSNLSNNHLLAHVLLGFFFSYKGDNDYKYD